RIHPPSSPTLRTGTSHRYGASSDPYLPTALTLRTGRTGPRSFPGTVASRTLDRMIDVDLRRHTPDSIEQTNLEGSFRILPPLRPSTIARGIAEKVFKAREAPKPPAGEELLGTRSGTRPCRTAALRLSVGSRLAGIEAGLDTFEPELVVELTLLGVA